MQKSMISCRLVSPISTKVREAVVEVEDEVVESAACSFRKFSASISDSESIPDSVSDDF